MAPKCQYAQDQKGQKRDYYYLKMEAFSIWPKGRLYKQNLYYYSEKQQTIHEKEKTFQIQMGALVYNAIHEKNQYWIEQN